MICYVPASGIECWPVYSLVGIYCLGPQPLGDRLEVIGTNSIRFRPPLKGINLASPHMLSPYIIGHYVS